MFTHKHQSARGEELSFLEFKQIIPLNILLRYLFPSQLGSVKVTRVQL